MVLVRRELKRIEMATVILRKPKLAIFDEPEAGIDLWSFQNLIEVFKKLRKNYHGTILVISHQEKIMEIADKILLLKRGKLEEVEKIDNLRIRQKCGCRGGCIHE